MIVEESKRMEKLELIEFEKNKTDIDIIYNENVTYTIQIIPNKRGVIIKYKSLKFKCDTFQEYTKIYKYIIKQIERETYNLISYRFDYMELPHDDMYFNKHVILIKRDDEIVFYNEYKGDNILVTSELHFPNLFYIMI